MHTGEEPGVPDKIKLILSYDFFAFKKSLHTVCNCNIKKKNLAPCT